MGDICLRPGRQVVQRVDLPAAREEELTQVRADEPGAAGDQCLSARAGASPVRTARAVHDLPQDNRGVPGKPRPQLRKSTQCAAPAESLSTARGVAERSTV